MAGLSLHPSRQFQVRPRYHSHQWVWSATRLPEAHIILHYTYMTFCSVTSLILRCMSPGPGLSALRFEKRACVPRGAIVNDRVGKRRGAGCRQGQEVGRVGGRTNEREGWMESKSAVVESCQGRRALEGEKTAAAAARTTAVETEGGQIKAVRSNPSFCKLNSPSRIQTELTIGLAQGQKENGRNAKGHHRFTKRTR